jgi:DNA-binding beta-propeller fold protein YncE
MRIIFTLLAFASSVLAAKLEIMAGGGSSLANAPATECSLREPFAVEFAPDGRMIIAEMVSGNRMLSVDKSGFLSVFAGTGIKGFSGDNGPALNAQFNGIHNHAIAKSGDIFIADSWNYRVRKISSSGAVTTLAGTGKKSFSGDGGLARDAGFSTIIQLALDPSEKHIFIADIENKRIRRIALDTGIVTTVAGNGNAGVPKDDSVAVDSPLSDPRAVVPVEDGSFYILERNGNALRHVDAAGKIRTVVGTGKSGMSTDPGPALSATMNGPKHACLDRDGTVIIADAENHLIRRYDPKTGLLTRIAGTGKKGAAISDDALNSELNRPHGVTIAPDGSLIITDSYNNRILRLKR